jgi:hypothetical protein
MCRQRSTRPGGSHGVQLATFLPAQQIVGEFLATFTGFPPHRAGDGFASSLSYLPDCASRTEVGGRDFSGGMADRKAPTRERRIDDLMERQTQTTDERMSNQLFDEVQQIFAEHLPIVHFVAPKCSSRPRLASPT